MTASAKDCCGPVLSSMCVLLLNGHRSCIWLSGFPFWAEILSIHPHWSVIKAAAVWLARASKKPVSLPVFIPVEARCHGSQTGITLSDRNASGGEAGLSDASLLLVYLSEAQWPVSYCQRSIRGGGAQKQDGRQSYCPQLSNHSWPVCFSQYKQTSERRRQQK